MPTNRNPNQNATVNTTGWTRSGSGTLTATADGARWVSSGGTGRKLTISVDDGRLAMNKSFAVCNMQVRRNSGTAQLSATLLSGVSIWVDDYGTGTFYSGSTGSTSLTRNLTDLYLPVGQFVTLPGGDFALWGGPSYGTGETGDYYNDNIEFYIYAQDGGAFDFTIKGVNLYQQGDTPALAEIDGNDCAFTYTQTPNTLGGTFSLGIPNEAVQTTTWNWGDGTTTTGPAGGSGQKSQGVSKTWATPGVYTVRCTSSNSWGQSVFSEQQVTVPVGTFQAAFSYQVDYPSILVDAGSSIAPSLSPVSTYAWNWGDGTTGAGKTASHSYLNPGTYNVTLTISNPTVQRTSSTTKTVVISAPPEQVDAPLFRMGLFLDDPASVIGTTTLQSEVVPILDADDIGWNWTRNEVPTLSFSVPSDWLTRLIGGALADLKSDLVVRLNFGAGWVEPPSGRMIVGDIDEDPLNPQTRVRVTCLGIAGSDLDGIYFTPGVIGTAYTAAEIKANYSRVFAATNAGTIMRTLLPVATTPGTGQPNLNFLNIDFSNTVNSKSESWLTTISNLAVPADNSGLDVLRTLVQSGACDWYCQGNLLRMFNHRASGKRGPNDAIPELLPGRDINAAPQKRTLRNQTYGAVVVPNTGAPQFATDSDPLSDSFRETTYRGRRYVAIQAESATSPSVALSLAKPTLRQLRTAKDGELSRELEFYEEMPWMPYRDYQVGDTVYAPGPDGKLVTLSVESITLAQNSQRGLSASVILGNAFEVNSLQQKVASLSGGRGINIGAVGERPPSAASGYIGTLVTAKVTNDNGTFDAADSLTLEGRGADGILATVTMGSSSSLPYVNAPPMYARTSSLAANMVVINSAGTICRSTSARKYKDDIAPADPGGDSILNLEPKTWFDKAELFATNGDPSGLRRYTGLIAEEVDEAGLDWAVTRDEGGEIEGLAYDRLWIPLIPIIRDLKSEVAELKRQLGDLMSTDNEGA